MSAAQWLNELVLLTALAVFWPSLRGAGIVGGVLLRLAVR